MPSLLRPTPMRVSEPSSARIPVGTWLRWAGLLAGWSESNRSPLVFRWLWLESHKPPGWLMAGVREGWDFCGKEREGWLMAF